jgi:hypothetical protein
VANLSRGPITVDIIAQTNVIEREHVKADLKRIKSIVNQRSLKRKTDDITTTTERSELSQLVNIYIK